MNLKAIETTYRVTDKIGNDEKEFHIIISDDVHKTVEIYARDTEGDFTVRLLDSTFDELFVLKNIIDEIIKIDSIHNDMFQLLEKNKVLDNDLFETESKIISAGEIKKSETLIITEQEPDNGTNPDQEPAGEIIPAPEEEIIIKHTPDNAPPEIQNLVDMIQEPYINAYIRIEANKKSIYFSAAAAKLLALKKDDRFYITGNLYFKIIISETEGSKVYHDTANNAYKAHCPEFVDILLKAGAFKFEFGEFHEGCYQLKPIIK